MPPPEFLLSSIAAITSFLVLLLTLGIRRKINHLAARPDPLEATLQEVERLLNFPPVPPPETVVSSSASSGRHLSPLARRIGSFREALARWCEAAGDHPTSSIMKKKDSMLQKLERSANEENGPRGGLAEEFREEAEGIVTAVVSATDRDFRPGQLKNDLEDHLPILVEEAGLVLIAPVPGELLDRQKHSVQGAMPGLNSTARGRETIASVMRRGLARTAASGASHGRVLTPAEVEANY